MHGVALDVHAEDLAGDLRRAGGVVGELHAAGLAPTAGLDLGLDDHAATAKSLRGRPRLVGGLGDRAVQHWHAVLGEEVPRLVLEQVHGQSVLVGVVRKPAPGPKPAGALWRL